MFNRDLATRWLDYGKFLISKISKALYAFSPVVWIASPRNFRSRELRGCSAFVKTVDLAHQVIVNKFSCNVTP